MRDRYGEFKRREAKRLVEEWEATAGRGISIREAGRVLEKMASKPAVVRDRYKSKGPKARTMEYNPERDGYGSSEPVLLGSQRERARSYTRGLAGQFIQGASANFSDEIAGAVSGVLHAGKAAFTDEEMGEAYHRGYDETTKEIREGLKEFQKAHPIASAGAQTVGAITSIAATGGLSAGAIAVRAGTAATQAGRAGQVLKAGAQALGSFKKAIEGVKGGKAALGLGKAATIGAAVGGSYGAGSGEGSFENRMDAAKEGATGGAITGVGTHGVNKLTKEGAGWLAEVAKPLTDNIKNSGLGKALSGAMGRQAGQGVKKGVEFVREQVGEIAGEKISKDILKNNSEK